MIPNCWCFKCCVVTNKSKMLRSGRRLKYVWLGLRVVSLTHTYDIYTHTYCVVYNMPPRKRLKLLTQRTRWCQSYLKKQHQQMSLYDTQQRHHQQISDPIPSYSTRPNLSESTPTHKSSGAAWQGGNLIMGLGRLWSLPRLSVAYLRVFRCACKKMPYLQYIVLYRYTATLLKHAATERMEHVHKCQCSLR